MSNKDSFKLQERMTSTAAHTVTIRDLVIDAAKAEYGPNIDVRNINGLGDFNKSIAVQVLESGDRPLPVKRTIVDISTKEFKNYAAEDGRDPTARDSTKATVTKSSATSKGRHYQYTSTQGVSWELNANIGLQILAMGTAGGSAGGGGKYGKNKSTSETTGNSTEETLGFEYSQEETVCVPPGKKVHVTITTYTVLYQLKYVLEFSVPKMNEVFVTYRKSCCCGLCRDIRTGRIPYWLIVRNLPGYREDSQNAYFKQDGELSWIGESCEVDKREVSVYAS